MARPHSQAFLPAPALRPVRARRAASPGPRVCVKSVVILGGSSGVGLETANYLKSHNATVTTFSRTTGHDLSDPIVSQSILPLTIPGLAISIGAGRRKSSRHDELTLYQTIISALRSAPPVSLVVAVARPLVQNDLRDMLDTLSSPWVLVRPGTLVDSHPNLSHPLPKDDLLVTTDLRCTGLVSRKGAATVVGDLLLGRVPLDQIAGKLLCVYDRNRMISYPNNVSAIADTKWGAPPAS